MSKLAFVYMLPSQIASEIKSFSDLDHRLYLGWQNEFAQALMHISVRASFQEFSGKLTDSLLLSIEFCSHELSKRCPEKVVEEDKLNELKTEARKLYDEILKADLDPALSRYLLDNLQMIIQAIENYVFTGARGIEQSIDAIVGTIVTKNKIATAAKASTCGEAFWGMVGKAAVLLQLAKTALELGEGVFKILPGK